MNKLRIYLFVVVSVVLASCSGSHKSSEMKPPMAKIQPKELIAHGQTRIDNYYWLNDRNDPEVIKYLQEENAYTDHVLSNTKSLQDKLFAEITGRIKQTDVSVPYKMNGYYYYTRYEEGDQYPIYCRKKGNMDSVEEILLDGNMLAGGFEYFHIQRLQVSEDNKLLAYSVDTLSRRIYTIYIKDLTTGEMLPDVIPGTSGDMAWANDNKTLFYSTKDETLRPDMIWRHVTGADTAEDSEVYHEADSTFNVGLFKSKSRDFILISSSSTLSSEYRILKADNPGGEFVVFQERLPEVEYSITHYKDRFYILTNHQAKNFRLMETPLDETGIEHWTEVIPHRDDVLLEEMEVFDSFIALIERINGLANIRILSRDGDDHYIKFAEQAYVASFDNNPEFDSDLLRFTYSSLTTPSSIYDYDVRSRSMQLLKRQEIVGGYDPDSYQTERIFAVASDGTRVPVSLVYKKGLVKDGNNPLLLYGYGSYGYSIDPSFNLVRISLLDRGFIYAIAHIRGGEEMGRKWYEDGKLLKKKNTFTDFIDCAEYLVSASYTNPDMLFAIGGSAGGLLIGAVVNMKPDLFRGVIAAVPFVDVVTTMLDESIPLTTAEYDEWGNPNDETYYRYMLSYSPYDNVRALDYPAMMVTTGLHDSQVQYWEPAKWVAKLRSMKTDTNPLVLWTNMDYGHGGASGRFEKYRETAMEYAFILYLAGIRE